MRALVSPAELQVVGPDQTPDEVFQRRVRHLVVHQLQPGVQVPVGDRPGRQAGLTRQAGAQSQRNGGVQPIRPATAERAVRVLATVHLR